MITGVEESNASENDVAQVETRHENEEAAHAVAAQKRCARSDHLIHHPPLCFGEWLLAESRREGRE